MAYLRDRRAFGNIGTRKFRGARFGDPLSPRGPQYTLDGRVLDYSTDVGPFTIIDQSGEGNTATLYSGRGLTMDAVGDNVTYATGYSSAERTATLLGRFNVVSPVVLGGQSGFFTFYPTATGVWEELTATATVSGDLDWELGSDFDIGDLRVGTEHWTHSDWSDPTADGLNGKTIVDSGPNGYHGVCTGCSGFTGEATIPQTADRNWNKYQWFNGVDTYVETTGMTADTDYFGACTITADVYIPDKTPASTIVVFALGFGSYRLYLTSAGIWGVNNGSTGVFAKEGLQTIAVSFDASGNAVALSVDGVTEWTGSKPPATSGTTFFIGARGPTTAGLFWDGLIYNFAITGSSVKNFAYTGLGNDPWKDTIGSNDGTEGGTFTRELVSASDANDQIDALGNAILEPRLNTQQLNLFGEGEYSSTPDSASLDLTTEATWEVWGNFYDDSVAYWIMAKAASAANDNAWVFYKLSGGGSEVNLALGNGSGGLSGLCKFYIPDKVVSVMVVYNGSTVQAYVDGLPVTTDSSGVPASLYANTQPIYLGTRNAGTLQNAPIKIGSTKIYNVALTADEVLTNYNTQKSLYGL